MAAFLRRLFDQHLRQHLLLDTPPAGELCQPPPVLVPGDGVHAGIVLRGIARKDRTGDVGRLQQRITVQIVQRAQRGEKRLHGLRERLGLCAVQKRRACVGDRL